MSMFPLGVSNPVVKVSVWVGLQVGCASHSQRDDFVFYLFDEKFNLLQE